MNDTGAPGVVRRLHPGDARQLDEFLAARPLDFIYPLGWLRRDGVSPRVSFLNFHFMGTFVGETLVASGLVAGDTLFFVAARERERAEELARGVVASGGNFRVLVGPKASVEAAWGVFAARGAKARLARDQVVLVSRRSHPQPEEPHLLRVATSADVDDLVGATMAMHAHETLEAPRPDEEPLFRRTLEYQVSKRRIYVITGTGAPRLRFKASISAYCSLGAQIEGVWVPPEWRGHGYGKRGLRQLCQELFRTVDTVSLYANEDNLPALRLYEKHLGFERSIAFKTVFIASV